MGPYEVWIDEGGAELAALLFEKSMVGELMASKDDNNQHVLSKEERLKQRNTW